MLPEEQKRILGYFIEEAKDHLNTIEQGLLNLQATIEDAEMVNEVFRAAHSVKGGAAMLGLDSIQRTAHRLEDYFKVLKEAPVATDRKLESMLLQIFDGMSEQLEQVQGPFGLTDDKAQEIMAGLEPVFGQTEAHLQTLPPVTAKTPAPAPDPAPVRAAAASPQQETSALQLVFRSDVPAQLRTMLASFKQADDPGSRSALVACCQQLKRMGEEFDLTAWCHLLEQAEQAVGNEEQSYRSLAPVLIKDIKQAQEQVLASKADQVVPSPALLEMVPAPAPALDDGSLDALLAEALATETTEPDLGDFLSAVEAVDEQASDLDAEAWLDSAADESESGASLDVDDDFAAVFDTPAPDPAPVLEPPLRSETGRDVEVGAAELNTLADLFENEAEDLAAVWEEEDLTDINAPPLDLTATEEAGDADFADLLEEAAPEAEANGDSDFDALFGTPLTADSAASESPDLAIDHDGAALGADGLEDADPLAALAELDEMATDSAEEDPLALALDLSTEFEDFGSLDGSEESAADVTEADALDFPSDLDDLAVDSPAAESLDLSLDWPADLDAATTDAGPGALNDDGIGDDGLTADVDLPDPEAPAADPSALAPSAEPAETSGAVDQAVVAPSEPTEAPAIPAPTNDIDDFFGLPDQVTQPVAQSLSASAEMEDFWAAGESAGGAEPPIPSATPPVEAPSPSHGEPVDDPFALDLAGLDADPFDTMELEDNGPETMPELNLDADGEPQALIFEVSPPEPPPAGAPPMDALDVDRASASEPNSGVDMGLDAWLDEALPAPALVEPGAADDDLASLDDLALGDLERGPESSPDPVLESPASATAGDGSPELAVELGDLELGDVDSALAGLDGLAALDTPPDENGADLTLADAPPIATVGALADLDRDLDLEPSDPDEALGEELDLESSDLDGDLDLDLEPWSNGATTAASGASAEEDLAGLDDLANLDDLSSPDDLEGLDGLDDLDLAVPESLNDVATDGGGLTETADGLHLAGVEDGGTSEETALEEFDDLDRLLDEPAPPLTEGALTAVDEAENLADLGDLNDFAELEALVEAESLAPAPPLPPEGDADFSALEALLDEDEPTDEDEDEFSDLEKLLKETDQGARATPPGNRFNPSPNQARQRAALADQTMRVSVRNLDGLNNLVGELVVNRNSLEQDQERLRQFLDNLLLKVQQLSDVGQRMRDLYERSLLESSLMSSRQALLASPSPSDNGGGHATGATFDALEMDRFTGFHTLSQEMIELIVRVRESSDDIAFTIDSTDEITRQFRQVTTQLQEGLNKTRMVPFYQTSDRLPRAVRDISYKCGKEAQLVVEGRDTLIDKMILERLYDPLTHLVNNAITHGIELPEERAAAGKPAAGTITIRAFYQGNQTVIYIADDGSGINPELVKTKALKRGLITPDDAASMTDIEVYELLFLPGFSTRDKADNFAGRGVGMDVVRTALADIRGSVTVESELGKGSSFTIRLPLTLSITKALSCVNNQARIAFPMDGVEDMFDVPRKRIQEGDDGQSSILWRDTLLPFRPLADLLRFNRSLGRGRVYGGNQDDDVVSIVVLRSANTYIGLQVDQVIGEQEIVIKQLEGPVPKPTGIAGATVLGDGRVMPIADVLELIDLSLGRLRRDSASSLWGHGDDEVPVQEQYPTKSEPTVLIVDDSITVRELLSMSFNKVGYQVEQARDGQEAWEKLRSGLPCDLVFCDIEMPRMDGLELLSRMQKDDVLDQVPIAMLTSRGADRHRQMAIDLGAKGYFTKPYLEEVLLDAAQRMLKGENMALPKDGE